MKGNLIRVTQLRLAIAGLILGGAGIFAAPAFFMTYGEAGLQHFRSNEGDSAQESRDQAVERKPEKRSWESSTPFQQRTY